MKVIVVGDIVWKNWKKGYEIDSRVYSGGGISATLRTHTSTGVIKVLVDEDKREHAERICRSGNE